MTGRCLGWSRDERGRPLEPDACPNAAEHAGFCDACRASEAGCDDCGAEEATPQLDPWGRIVAWRCENCAMGAWDDAQERAMEGPSRPAYVSKSETRRAQ